MTDVKGWYGKLNNGMLVSVYVDNDGINFCLYDPSKKTADSLPTHAFSLPFNVDGEQTKPAATQVAIDGRGKVEFGEVAVPVIAREIALLAIQATTRGQWKLE